VSRRVLDEAAQARAETRHAAAEVVWYVLVAAALALVALSAGVSAAAVSPRYCAACHPAEASGATSGPHASLRCESCHARPGGLGLAEQRVRVVGMVPAAIAGAKAGGAGRVYDAQCLACHAKQIAGRVTAQGLTMSHQEVLAAGWACERCHGSVAHGGQAAGFRARYDMDACLECHSQNPRDIDACSTCHVEGGESRREDLETRTPWRVTHGAGWRHMHGMGNLKTCQACHAPAKCVECHHMQVPHPLTFKKTHGRDVLARDTGRADCVVCHQGSSCDDCHGIAMPHPTGFLEGHSALVERDGRTVCGRCHDKQSCDDCHTRHAHPGIPPDTLKKLKARPAQ